MKNFCVSGKEMKGRRKYSKIKSEKSSSSSSSSSSKSIIKNGAWNRKARSSAFQAWLKKRKTAWGHRLGFIDPEEIRAVLDDVISIVEVVGDIAGEVATGARYDLQRASVEQQGSQEEKAYANASLEFNQNINSILFTNFFNTVEGQLLRVGMQRDEAILKAGKLWRNMEHSKKMNFARRRPFLPVAPTAPRRKVALTPANMRTAEAIYAVESSRKAKARISKLSDQGVPKEVILLVTSLVERMVHNPERFLERASAVGDSEYSDSSSLESDDDDDDDDECF